MMASPQKEHGYTGIANEIIEALLKANLSAQEFKIILLIIRKTYGYRKKEDYISLRQIAQATGASVNGCSRAVNKLHRKKMIGVNRTVEGLPNKYKFNKDYSQWKGSTEVVTINRSGQKGVNRSGDNKRNVYLSNKRKEVDRKSTEIPENGSREVAPSSPGVKKVCHQRIKDFCREAECNLYKNSICEGGKS
jgi:phage replication O-like protein O